MSVEFGLRWACMTGIGIERDHGFATLELGTYRWIIWIIIGIKRHGRDAMAQVGLVCRGPLRWNRSTGRVIRLVWLEGLFSPIISICHIMQLLTLSGAISYLDSSTTDRALGPVNGFNGRVGGARVVKRGIVGRSKDSTRMLFFSVIERKRAKD
jgi:hypothetical protein